MRKLHKKKVDNSFFILATALILAILVIVFTLANQNSYNKFVNSSKDRVCGEFSDKFVQDKCCFDLYGKNFKTDCEGKWDYISGNRRCQYVCAGILPKCTEDFKACESGDVVGRNPENECEFYSCP